MPHEEIEPSFIPEMVQEFFIYARKRYQLKLDKEADFERPWTMDPILQQFRFCNVFREDDKVTTWFRENIREPLRGDQAVLFATIMFRWFNKIETGQKLLETAGLGIFKSFQPELMRDILKDQKPLVTAAYMIKTPAGMNKLDGIIWCLSKFANHHEKPMSGTNVEYAAKLFAQKHYTMEMATKYLAEFPYIGDFMAYEIVTDLRHTHMFENASDIMTWANPGPGAARGLSRMLGMDKDALDRHKEQDRQFMFRLMKKLLNFANGIEYNYWPHMWPRWEMREVEHTLCEVDKYLRARSGLGRPKQLYKPS